MSFFIVSSDKSSYADTAKDAAIAAGAMEYSWLHLSKEISKLGLGDELCVDSDVSVFRVSGTEIQFTGTF